MEETERIAEQLRLLFEGPSWLGPSIDALLADVSEVSADARPFPRAHTIRELALHMEAWLRITRLRLTASSPVNPVEEENWPTPTASWQHTIASLRDECAALRQAILNFPPHRLGQTALAIEPQTFYILLHGVIQHSAYHAGQIAILKKVLV